ncbi:hypothetical protein B0H14DRAFT_2642015 [Mycena olivaceomarginata]|nr:hypothetical protein B0H14DRAFT_2642015 [Mycena olivaceomarginata]
MSQMVAQVEETKKISWIWVSEGTMGMDKMSQRTSMEWAKKWAKAMHYTEGINLLEEEMRCMLQFLQWRADWWTSLVGFQAEKQEALALWQGHAAYVRKQAGYMQGLRDHFEHQWRDVVKEPETAWKPHKVMMPDAEEKDGAPGMGKDSGQTNISPG